VTPNVPRGDMADGNVGPASPTSSTEVILAARDEDRLQQQRPETTTEPVSAAAAALSSLPLQQVVRQLQQAAASAAADGKGSSTLVNGSSLLHQLMGNNSGNADNGVIDVVTSMAAALVKQQQEQQQVNDKAQVSMASIFLKALARWLAHSIDPLVSVVVVFFAESVAGGGISQLAPGEGEPHSSQRHYAMLQVTDAVALARGVVDAAAAGIPKSPPALPLVPARSAAIRRGKSPWGPRVISS